MLHVFRTPLRCGLILTAFFSAAPAASAAPARIVRGIEATDAWMLAPTAAEQAFMRARCWRVRTSAHPFDRSLFSARGAWMHQHAFGLEPAELAA